MSRQWTYNSPEKLFASANACLECRKKYQGLQSEEGVIAELVHRGSLRNMKVLNNFEIELLLPYFVSTCQSPQNSVREADDRCQEFFQDFFVGRGMSAFDQSPNCLTAQGGEIYVHVGDNEIEIEHAQGPDFDLSGTNWELFGRREFIVVEESAHLRRAFGARRQHKVFVYGQKGFRGWTKLWDVNGSIILRKKTEILEEIQHEWEHFFKWYRQIRQEITETNSPLKTPFCEMAAIASESYELESSELASSDLEPSDDLDSDDSSDGKSSEEAELASNDSEEGKTSPVNTTVMSPEDMLMLAYRKDPESGKILMQHLNRY